MGVFGWRLLISPSLEERKRMGCVGSHGGSPEDDERMKKSKEIEQTLRKDRKEIAKEMRVLLLGAGETGKTT